MKEEITKAEMGFIKYPHLERFGRQAVSDLHDGLCYIMPKLDGTNAQVWYDKDLDLILAGSRNRLLDETSDGDNAGFCKFARKNENLRNFFKSYPDLRVYGEFLVPHSLKTYRDDAWKKFYIFDIVDKDGKFINYDDYRIILDEFGLDYIPVLWKMEFPTEQKLIELSKKNTFLIKDGEGFGEGLVVKRYEWINKYGRVTWAKLVTNEFKEKNTKEFGANVIKSDIIIEQEIVDAFCTEEFIKKEHSKLLVVYDVIELPNKKIPELLNRVYYEFLTEEAYEFVKKFKNPTINFKVLNALVLNKTKEVLKGVLF